MYFRITHHYRRHSSSCLHNDAQPTESKACKKCWVPRVPYDICVNLCRSSLSSLWHACQRLSVGVQHSYRYVPAQHCNIKSTRDCCNQFSAHSGYCSCEMCDVCRPCLVLTPCFSHSLRIQLHSTQTNSFTSKFRNGNIRSAQCWLSWKTQTDESVYRKQRYLAGLSSQHLTIIFSYYALIAIGHVFCSRESSAPTNSFGCLITGCISYGMDWRWKQFPVRL